jgi:hypothetical protein
MVRFGVTFAFLNAEAEHQRGVAVFFLRALADHRERARFDDRHALNVAVLAEDLRHAELATKHTGLLIHDDCP